MERLKRILRRIPILCSFFHFVPSGSPQRLKKVLRRIPGVRRGARLVRFVTFILHEAWWAWWLWVDPEKLFDQVHVERLWNFAAPRSQAYYSRVLAVVAEQSSGDRWGDTLEIGCSEGVFTAELACRCRSVSAYDISPTARARAAERCAQFPTVRIGPLDLTKDEIPGQYDLAFAMDVLSMVRGCKQMAAAAGKLSNALRSGGILAFGDCRMPLNIRRRWWSQRSWSRWLPMNPDEYVELFEKSFGLRLVHREVFPPESEGLPDSWDWVIALFQKDSVPQP